MVLKHNAQMSNSVLRTVEVRKSHLELDIARPH